MYFSKSLQGIKSAITMRPVSIESTLLLFLLTENFLVKIHDLDPKQQMLVTLVPKLKLLDFNEISH